MDLLTVLRSCFNYIELRTILLTIIFAFSIKYLQNLHKRNPLITKLVSEITGPLAFPVFGNGLNFVFAGAGGQLILQQKWIEKYGSVYRVWIGNDLAIVTSDIDHLKTIFSSKQTLKKGRPLAPFAKVFPRGLVVNPDVHDWRINRKRLQPYFTNEVVSSYVPIMNQQIREFATLIKDFADGTEHDIRELFIFLSMKMVLKTEFNYEMDWANRHLATEFNENLEKIVKLISLQMFLPILRMEIFHFFLYKGWLYPVKKKCLTFFKEMYEHYLNSMKLVETNESTDNPTYRSSFVRGSIELLKDGVDEDSVLTELFETVSAAFNTFALTNSFVTLMIAMHPEIQKKLHREVDEIFGDDDRFPNVTDINRLTYLDCVIKETQRRFTLVPTLLRQTENDIYLGKHLVPKGTDILISVIMVHMNPSLYPRPYEFNPENFSPEKVKTRPQYSFIPFSAGARNCIGKKFAEMELRLTMTTLLREFEFHTSMKMEDIKLHFGFVAYNESGFPVSFIPRKQKGQLK